MTPVNSLRTLHTMSPLLLPMLLAVGACRPSFDATVTLGDPVPNLLNVAFETPREGHGRVVLVSKDKVAPEWPMGALGDAHDLTFFGAPAGDIELRPELVLENGRVIRGAAVAVTVPALPAELPRVHVRSPAPLESEVRKGWVLFNVIAQNSGVVLAVNGDGDIVWWDHPPDEDKPLRARVGRDGNSILYASVNERNNEIPERGRIIRWQLGESSPQITRAVGLHHDFVELPSGDLAWLAYVDELHSVAGQDGILRVRSDAIRTTVAGGVEGEESTVFYILDDSPEPLTLVCDHMLPSGNGSTYDWTHSNSLVWDDATASLRFLVRHWDAVVEVGLDGEQHWQAGGLQNDWNLQGWMDHGHASELAGNDWWIHSNNNHDTPNAISDYVRLTVDPETGTATERERVPEPYGRFASYLGDVRTLPNDHLLVAFAPTGHLMELDEHRDIVWELWLDVPNGIGRIAFVPQLGG